MAYIANIAFACKTVNERAFLETTHTVFEIRGNNTLNLRMTNNLTELKHQLMDLLICSSSCMGARLIHSNLRYTGHLSGSNFDSMENCKYLYLMVLMITSSDYSFINKVVLIKLNSSANFGLELTIKVQWTKGFIKLILCLGR